MAKKKKPKNKRYEPLKFGICFKPSFVFYFKTILYNLVLNILFFFFLNKYIIAGIYLYFPSIIFLLPFSTPQGVATAINLIVVYAIKMTVYCVAIENMYKEQRNEILNILLQVTKRFFPIMITIIVAIAVIAFMTLLFIIPGIMWFVYSYFAIHLTILRTRNTGSIKGAKPYMGIYAVLRSRELTYGNVIRILFYNIFLGIILYAIPFYISLSMDLTQIPQLNTFLTIKYILLDFLIVFSVLAFFKSEETLEELTNKNLGEGDIQDALAYNEYKTDAGPITKGRKK